MDNRKAAAIAVLLAAGGAWWYSRRQASAPAADTGGAFDALTFSIPDLFTLDTGPVQAAAQPVESLAWSGSDILSGLGDSIMQTIAPGSWTPPAAAAPYLADIYAAEDRNGIPRNLLARLIWKESRYRPEIIDGSLKSSAGAIGIAQIVPKWHPDVDPYNPQASIAYAGTYMARLKSRFGSWPLALAAYNWGEGNLSKYGIDRAPAETRDYVASITSAVAVA